MKPYIIFFKGAVHHRSDPIFAQAQALSGAFEGEYWTYGSMKIEETIGTFRLHCLKVHDEGGLGQIFAYAPRVVAAFLRRRKDFRERDAVVVSYDPFIHGLIAALVAWLIGAKLVVEMPGAYENSDRFPKGWKRWLAISRQKIMAQVAVWRANAVRFIFDNQITKFVSIPRSTLVMSYFDAANIDRFGEDLLPEEKVILLVGFPYYIKGCDILIEAWRNLSARYPDWRLVLIGHELDLHRDEVEARVHRISFLKSMPNAEVARWVSRAAIFALPSRSDALPRVLMEAAAAGKARIGSAVDGIPRLIADDIDGLLVPPKDPVALAKAIERLIEDPELRARLGAAARMRVFRDFSTARYIEDLQACISRLFAPHACPAAPPNERIRSGVQ